MVSVKNNSEIMSPRHFILPTPSRDSSAFLRVGSIENIVEPTLKNAEESLDGVGRMKCLGDIISELFFTDTIAEASFLLFYKFTTKLTFRFSSTSIVASLLASK